MPWRQTSGPRVRDAAETAATTAVADADVADKEADSTAAFAASVVDECTEVAPRGRAKTGMTSRECRIGFRRVFPARRSTLEAAEEARNVCWE